jgi:succinoglycan biosynthesis protein ExoV
MKLFWYVSKNFGDCLNQWLWPKVFGCPLSSLFHSDDLFLGIGTILSEKIPASLNRKIVFGSGAGYGMPPYITQLWHVYSVRGPLTAKALELSPSLAVTDPAILCSKYITPAIHRSGIAIMLHHHNPELQAWNNICSRLGITFIDPTGDIDTIFQTINSTEVLYAEAMHGAIIADSLRVPWVPIQASNHINNFKWSDWTQSMNIHAPLRVLPSIRSTGKHRYVLPIQSYIAEYALRSLAKVKPYLSTHKVFQLRLEQMDSIADRILQDAHA